VVLSLAGATFAQVAPDHFLLTSSKNASLNGQYLGRAKAANLCSSDSALPCLKTSQVVISNGALAGDNSRSFKLHYAASPWVLDQVETGRRSAGAPTLYALHTAPGIMRKLALLRKNGEHHFSLIDVTLQWGDLSYAYIPSDGNLSWDNFKIDRSTSQISIETEDDAKQPKRTWVVATPKGKSSPMNIALWDGVSAHDEYHFTPIALRVVPAEGA